MVCQTNRNSPQRTWPQRINPSQELQANWLRKPNQNRKTIPPCRAQRTRAGLTPLPLIPRWSAKPARFSPVTSNELRSRWDAIQVGFVDEPRRAVELADNLVAGTMKRLAEIFTDERSMLEGQWDRGKRFDGGPAAGSTPLSIVFQSLAFRLARPRDLESTMAGV